MQYTQEQVENKIANVMPHGVREIVAKGTGIYPKIVDAYFNPNDERKSPHFQTLHIQAVLDNDPQFPGVGDAVWAEMCAMREASRPGVSGQISLIDALIQKLASDSDTSQELATAIADGRIDPNERKRLIPLIARERELLDTIEELVLGKRPAKDAAGGK